MTTMWASITAYKWCGPNTPYTIPLCCSKVNGYWWPVADTSCTEKVKPERYWFIKFFKFQEKLLLPLLLLFSVTFFYTLFWININCTGHIEIASNFWEPISFKNHLCVSSKGVFFKYNLSFAASPKDSSSIHQTNNLQMEGHQHDNNSA